MEARSVRIILVGDTGVGKTTLVKCVTYESFPATVPDTLNPVTEQINQIETELIDTNSNDIEDVEKKLRSMNPAESCIVCLVCAAGWTESIDNVKHKWLQLVEKHSTQIPIMIIINNKKQLDQQASPVTEEEIFRDFEDTVANKKQVEFVIIGDASEIDSVREVFDTAQRLALFPSCKLIDLKSPNPDVPEMRPELESALKHIFRRADVDGDGILNERELNEMQRACFTEGELGSDMMAGLMSLVEKEAPQGVTTKEKEKGFNWIGFEYIWKKMLEKGRYETFWVILRHCGFNDELKLSTSSMIPPDTKDIQELVLTDAAVEFLRHLFTTEINIVNATSVGGLDALQVQHLFDLIPPSNRPFPSEHFATYNALRSHISDFILISSHSNSPASSDDSHSSLLSEDGWISLWHLLTKIDPYVFVAGSLPYLGFGMSPLSAKPSKSSSSAKSNVKPADALRAVPHSFSSNLLVDIIGLPGSGRTHLMRGLLNYPFVADLPVHHQTMSLGVVGISVATTAFKKTAPLALKSAQGKSKSKGAANTSDSKAQKKATEPWLPRSDLVYQRNMAWERGVLIVNKYNLESYFVDPVLRTPDVVLVCFDVSDYEAFERLAAWLRPFRASYSHLKILLVGTKSDLHDVTISHAESLASDLHLPPPIITSVHNDSYAGLVPRMHQEMIQQRSTKWNTSAVSVISQSMFGSGNKLTYTLIATSAVVGLWFAAAHTGYLRPYIDAIKDFGHYSMMQLVRYAFLKPMEYFRHLSFEIARNTGPKTLMDIENRTAPSASPILPGTQQRLGTQRL